MPSHRPSEGVNRGDVLDEEYVRRNLSPSEREEIASNQRLVEPARQRMQKDLGAGRPGARRPDENR